MRPILVCLSIALASLACSHTPPSAVREPTARSIATVSADASVADASVADAAPAPPSFSIAETLPADRAVVFTERPGETLTLHPEQGADVTLRDGEVVTFVDEVSGVGGGDATSVIEAHGVRGTVPNARVITEARLSRSPDRQRAAFAAIASCGDLCHEELWLFTASGERVRISENVGVDVVVAWRPDSARLAVGDGSLTVVSVADGHGTTIENFTSPAYAPDGALFARGSTTSDDAVYEVTDGAAPRRVFGSAGRPPARPVDDPREMPRAVEFEQEGRVLRAYFRRGPTREVMARATREGRPATGPSADVIEVERFMRAHLSHCNAERERLHESAVFPEGTTLHVLRAVAPRAFTVRIERPGTTPVEVVAELGRGRIRAVRGANTALPGGLDFCPPPVWVGPHND